MTDQTIRSRDECRSRDIRDTAVRAIAVAVIGVVGLLGAGAGVRAEARPSARVSEDDRDLRQQAEVAMWRATQFAASKLARHDGYLWRYSEDLSLSEGEKRARSNMIMVQPPGSPSVGMAFVRAYSATADERYLKLAVKVANALIDGQLESGGWSYNIRVGSDDFRYRNSLSPNTSGRNDSVLDDDVTQSVLRFLIRLDAALGFSSPRISAATQLGLTSVLKAQYANGAWPQWYDGPVDAARHPARPVNLPTAMPGFVKDPGYRKFYTFNDAAIPRATELMLIAYRTYQDERYLQSAIRAAEFSLRARISTAQPVWAQQYNFAMEPAWGRKYEPPAVSGRESQDVLQALLSVYEQTGIEAYALAVQAGLRWMEQSVLPDGRLARFYEIGSNRPLYFDKAYALTYDDASLPGHYRFKVKNRAAEIRARLLGLERRFTQAAAGNPPRRHYPLDDALRRRVRYAIGSLDKQGRWLDFGVMRNRRFYDSEGTGRVINTATFVARMRVLSDFLMALKSETEDATGGN